MWCEVLTRTDVPYTANDPSLLAYVHSTLVDSALVAADVYGPRLSPTDRDRYAAEMARVAEALGLPDPPRDAASANTVIMSDAARCENRAGRDLAWLLALPPLPIWMRPGLRRTVRERGRLAAA